MSVLFEGILLAVDRKSNVLRGTVDSGGRSGLRLLPSSPSPIILPRHRCLLGLICPHLDAPPNVFRDSAVPPGFPNGAIHGVDFGPALCRGDVWKVGGGEAFTCVPRALPLVERQVYRR